MARREVVMWIALARAVRSCERGGLGYGSRDRMGMVYWARGDVLERRALRSGMVQGVALSLEMSRGLVNVLLPLWKQCPSSQCDADTRTCAQKVSMSCWTGLGIRRDVEQAGGAAVC